MIPARKMLNTIQEYSDSSIVIFRQITEKIKKRDIRSFDPVSLYCLFRSFHTIYRIYHGIDKEQSSGKKGRSRYHQDITEILSLHHPHEVKAGKDDYRLQVCDFFLKNTRRTIMMITGIFW